MDEVEIIRALEDMDSDNSEIENNVIKNFEDDSDADPDYNPHLIQEEDIIDGIFNIENVSQYKKKYKNPTKTNVTVKSPMSSVIYFSKN